MTDRKVHEIKRSGLIYTEELDTLYRTTWRNSKGQVIVEGTGPTAEAADADAAQAHANKHWGRKL
jgi:hypothetical protein